MQRFALLQTGHVLGTWLIRWKSDPVRKRHVAEPERLRQLAAKLKGQAADKLSREADALLTEADALEGAHQRVHSKSQPPIYLTSRLI